MGLTKYRLGDLIERSSEKNIDVDNRYSEEAVRGISNLKEFMVTKANLNERKLDNFLIVPNNHFAFNRRTTRMGEKFAIALNDSSEVYIVTSDYVVFSVKNVEVLSPSFLFIYFNRPEFDRYVRWESWGSSTEFFNWEQICDIEINLPSIAIQKKYVAIYQAMLENQEVYEEGLEDLKLVCEATIEEFRRKIPSDKIGPFISRGIKNTDGEFTEVLGIGGAGFIPPQKKPNKSLKNYKIMREGAIVYAPPLYNINSNAIHLYTNNYVSVCSPIYEVFYTDKNILLPEYLILWLKREEFKRYAAFNALGVRNTFDYNLMEEFSIPIPQIEIQKSIANIYKVYTERKEINEKLKEQIKSICPILIKGAMEEARREGV